LNSSNYIKYAQNPIRHGDMISMGKHAELTSKDQPRQLTYAWHHPDTGSS